MKGEKLPCDEVGKVRSGLGCLLGECEKVKGEWVGMTPSKSFPNSGETFCWCAWSVGVMIMCPADVSKVRSGLDWVTFDGMCCLHFWA